MDGLFDDDEYHRQKRLLEMELESLVVPQANAAEEAGKLIRDLPRLWADASLTERRKLLLTVLDAIYVDAKGEKRIVAIKPKAPFVSVFRVATVREGFGLGDVRLASLNLVEGPQYVTIRTESLTL